MLYWLFLMTRRPPISTRTDTPFPYTTLFRSRRSGLLAAFRPAHPKHHEPRRQYRAQRRGDPRFSHLNLRIRARRSGWMASSYFGGAVFHRWRVKRFSSSASNAHEPVEDNRSEERRLGKECVSKC